MWGGGLPWTTKKCTDGVANRDIKKKESGGRSGSLASDQPGISNWQGRGSREFEKEKLKRSS